MPDLSTDEPVVTNPSDKDEFLRTARNRFEDASDSETTVREQASSDLAFRTGSQWDAAAKQIRDDDQRPCLTINRIPQYLNQITNEIRQNPPALIVSPEGQGADRDAADIWQGLIRHIQVRSNADIAHETAFENAVGNSFGWWRILTEYAGVDTFDQEIKIERILDPFSVYIDPGAKEADRSDMQWAFVVTSMTREEFKRKYPHTSMAKSAFFDEFSTNSPGPNWVDSNNVQIAEYWNIEYKKRKLQMLIGDPQSAPLLKKIFGESKHADITADGELMLTAYADEYDPSQLPVGMRVENERDIEYPQVMWYKITGSDILEKTEWPGRWIPLIPCFGTEVMVNGKKMLISLTRFIRDSQALYNYFRSQQAEVIALTPKAPFIGPVGAFKTHYRMWQNANKTNYAYLEYDVVYGPNGNPAPPPQRNAVEPPIQAINQAVMQANDDFKAGTGIYDPSLGAQSNEVSGKAILARQQESNTSNYHFMANFKHSMKHEGRILMDLIPHIYDRKERIIRIVKPDTESEMVMINGDTDYKGKPVFFDPSVGRYDVLVDIGPSYQTKQQQIFEMLSQFVQTNPQLWSVMGDLIMRAAPLPGSLGNEAAQRMKAILAPGVQAMADGNKPPDPETMAKLQQAMQMVQLLQSKVQELQTVVDTKVLEITSKERIATMQEQTKILLGEMKAGMQDAEHLAAVDFETLQRKMNGLEILLQHELDKQLPQPAAPAAPTKQQ